MSDPKSLAEMKAERDRLDRQIAAAEEESALGHNQRMEHLQTDLELFANFHGLDTATSRRKNAVNLDLGSLRAGTTLHVSLYYEEDEYPVGGAAVTVRDGRSGVTASFDGVPAVDALVGLIAGWLNINRTAEQ